MAHVWDTRLIPFLCSRHLYQAWDDTMMLIVWPSQNERQKTSARRRLRKIQDELILRDMSPRYVDTTKDKKRGNPIILMPLYVMVAKLAGTKCGCDVGVSVDFGVPNGDKQKTTYTYRIGKKFYSNTI